MPDREAELLEEIRDLLKEQLRITAELKAQNEAAFRRNVEYMEKAEKMGSTSLAHSQAVFGSWGWMKWGFWIFLAVLLLLFVGPAFWSFLRLAS